MVFIGVLLSCRILAARLTRVVFPCGECGFLFSCYMCSFSESLGVLPNAEYPHVRRHLPLHNSHISGSLSLPVQPSYARGSSLKAVFSNTITEDHLRITGP